MSQHHLPKEELVFNFFHQKSCNTIYAEVEVFTFISKDKSCPVGTTKLTSAVIFPKGCGQPPTAALERACFWAPCQPA